MMCLQDKNTTHDNIQPRGTRDTGAAAKPADLPEGSSIHHSIQPTLSQSHDKNMEKQLQQKNMAMLHFDTFCLWEIFSRDKGKSHAWLRQIQFDYAKS